VAVSDGVPMPRAVLLGGLDEPLDLAIGEIFTAALANCYIYCGWSRFAKPRVFYGNRPPAYSYCYRFGRRCNRLGCSSPTTNVRFWGQSGHRSPNLVVMIEDDDPPAVTFVSFFWLKVNHLDLAQSLAAASLVFLPAMKSSISVDLR
jgi:hypothetical protein